MSTMTPETDAALKAQILADYSEVQALARQITTPEQFETILHNVVDLALRAQVERMLTPLLTFEYPGTRLDA